MLNLALPNPGNWLFLSLVDVVGFSLVLGRAGGLGCLLMNKTCHHFQFHLIINLPVVSLFPPSIQCYFLFNEKAVNWEFPFAVELECALYGNGSHCVK